MPRVHVPKASTIALLLANLVPIALVLALEWTVPMLLHLYWFELIVVGLFTIAQMRRAHSAGPLAKSLGYQIIFFVAHYSTFCVIYRVLLVQLIWEGAPFPPAFWLAFAIPLLALAAAHLVSYRKDFLAGERGRLTPFQSMWLPYYREAPVHVVLVTAALLMKPAQIGLAATFAYAILKLAADAGTHVVYHHALLTREAGRGLAENAWDE